MRVNELSKELGKTNKEVLEILQKNQFDVKSHASSISDDQAAIVRRTLGAGPVSYTHLDVYKRQLENRRTDLYDVEDKKS